MKNKLKAKRTGGSGLGDRVLALHVQGPRFNP
jgi:hypothetical protein